MGAISISESAVTKKTQQLIWQFSLPITHYRSQKMQTNN
ncbi:hypothetical protein APA_678 [Pseudanabaena sp. lw0831]|nr:hypothetical protein APA_678 [Pseudanabaena sp. lw0831]